jgi:hypothetical protein
MWLSNNDRLTIDQLTKTKNDLLQIAKVRLSERGDESDSLGSAADVIGRGTRLRDELEDVRQLGDDLKVLNAKIDARGRDLLHSQTSAEIAELEKLFKTFSMSGEGGTRDISENDVKNAVRDAQKLLSAIDDILERGAKIKEVVRKGQAYANGEETKWHVQSKKNEMTDKVDQVAVSEQRSDGIVVEVKGFCESGQVRFTALIVDEEGKPTIDLPLSINATGAVGTKGLLRLNDGQPISLDFVPKGNFRNELLLVSLSKSEGASNPLPGLLFQSLQPIVFSDIWRIYVQLETSRGAILIKIPVYDGAVLKMINSCELQ